jgi:hypothetical protein
MRLKYEQGQKCKQEGKIERIQERGALMSEVFALYLKTRSVCEAI